MSEMRLSIEANALGRKSVVIMVRWGLDLRSDSGAKAHRSIIVDGPLGCQNRSWQHAIGTDGAFTSASTSGDGGKQKCPGRSRGIFGIEAVLGKGTSRR